MKDLTGLQIIELKLENGVQLFSAQEIAYLLNTIRILKAEKEKGNN
jgi:hypothetical protein